MASDSFFQSLDFWVTVTVSSHHQPLPALLYGKERKNLWSLLEFWLNLNLFSITHLSTFL
ncbi:hypothetical protein Csa_003506 [Cucumis sativus]|uniref:Uncharacterized protein n=1 Tax=Cucumis sativus TaxID=3659 RepID=A0A0A0KMU8_CUCSA|nr:hypothetical protein Csa_003506 [Cucumis sativus]